MFPIIEQTLLIYVHEILSVHINYSTIIFHGLRTFIYLALLQYL